jgi:hypothetical protein
MGTTELQVEQVIVGGVVLAAVLLPWAPEILTAFAAPQPLAGLATGAGLLYLAYVLGVVFDRLADTLTEWLDGCQRLLVAEEMQRAKDTPQLKPDPFPEGRLRMKVLRDSGDVGRWLDYHRSRTRITRALAVYLPFVTWSLALGLGRFHPWDHDPDWRICVGPVVLIAMIVGVQWLSERIPKLPKTWEYEPRGAFLKSVGAGSPGAALSPMLRHPAVWLGGVLCLAAIAMAVRLETRTANRVPVLVPTLACASFAALSWWAWWRISLTFRGYLLLSGLKDEAKSPCVLE